MNNLLTFIKNKKLLATVIIFIVIIIIIKTFNSKSSKVENPVIVDSKPETISYKGIKPGENFNNDKVNELLGYPVSTTTDNDLEINKYKSSNEYRTNELIIKDNQVEFIKEVVNNNTSINSEQIRRDYGVAEQMLFKKTSNSYFDLYVYPSKGMAYLGHKDGTVLEIWYFKPMSIDSFIETYAKDYQKTPFNEQTGY